MIFVVDCNFQVACYGWIYVYQGNIRCNVLIKFHKIPTDPWNIPQVPQNTNMVLDFLHKQVVEGFGGA